MKKDSKWLFCELATPFEGDFRLEAVGYRGKRDAPYRSEGAFDAWVIMGFHTPMPLTIGNNTWTIPANQMAIIRPHEKRAYGRQGTWEHTWLRLKGSQLDTWTDRFDLPVNTPFECPLMDSWECLIQAVGMMASQDAPVAAVIEAWLAGLNTLVTKDTTPHPLHATREYIRQQCTTALHLNDMADHAGLAPAYFSDLFKQTYGLSPNTFLNQQRLNHALDLLTDQSMTLDDIGRACGYKNGFYFSRVFKKVYGVSPGAWRRGRVNSLQLTGAFGGFATRRIARRAKSKL